MIGEERTLRRIRHVTGIACALAGAAGVLGSACTTKSSGGNPAADFDASGGDATFDNDSGTDASGPDAADTSVADVTLDVARDAPSPVDASTPDAPGASDAAAPIDSSAAPDAAEAGACQPGTLTGFVAPTSVNTPGEFSNPPCNPFPGVPSPVPGELATDCFGDAATYDTCSSFDAGSAGSACLDCLQSEAVDNGTPPTPNYAGCIASNDPTDGGLACALQVEVAAACTYYVCAPSCPVVDQVSQSAYQTCVANAATGVCASYSAPATACVAAEKGDGSSIAGSVCLPGSESANFLSIAYYFCSKS
jgi:hypothetical protein